MTSISEHEIVEKLIELTVGKKINWAYLDSSKSVYDALDIIPRKDVRSAVESLLVEYSSQLSDKQKFDPDNSYYTRINSNYVVLYVSAPKSNDKILAERMNLLFVPNTFRSIEKVDNVDGLVRLHTIVKSHFPSVENIIDDILKM